MPKNTNTEVKFKTTIGGQALIEGILMRGPDKQAVAIRTPEGDIKLKIDDLHLTKDRNKILGLPFIRGVVTFLDSMVKGMQALMYSAEFYPEDNDNAEPDKLEMWIEKHFGAEALSKFIIYFAVFLGIGFSVALFIMLPALIFGLLQNVIPSFFVRNLIEGVVRIVLFMAYLIMCSKQSDMKRVFCYHGAEHKTIYCYEKQLPLTVENVRPMPRYHPRCGTSFLFVVMVISILIFSVVRVKNVFLQIVCKLLLLPLVVGITYEINRFLGRHDNWFSRICAAPGLWMQNFTTNEPDDSMIECAIAAMKEVIPTETGKDTW